MLSKVMKEICWAIRNCCPVVVTPFDQNDNWTGERIYGNLGPVYMEWGTPGLVG